MKVLIDNGHGENTPGKRSPDGRLREWAYTRKIADRVMIEVGTRGKMLKEWLKKWWIYLYPYDAGGQIQFTEKVVATLF